MKMTFLSRFTPSLMPPETLEAIFVQRHDLANDLVDAIRESAISENKHFRLLLGMRGIGKTHMVTLVYHRISKMIDLRDKLVIAWLREEEWGVTTFLDLLLRIFRALQKEYPVEYDIKLNQQVEALYKLSQEEAELKAASLLREFIENRTLLLIAENLDDLFNGLGDIGQKQLRAYIQNYSFITILATAQSLFDGVNRQDDPFYGFFYPHYLEDLEISEAIDLLKQIAQLEGDRELEEFICTATGNSRIYAVHHLAGGNPRVYVIFSQFLTRKSLDEMVEPFMRMLDDLTPYYQARMSWLSQQQRKIIEFLVERRHAVTVKEIAQRCFITHQTTSSQLKDLRSKGYVSSEAIGRESFYELREPLMRFCLEVKKQREEPIRLFVDFLRCWYTKDELLRRLGIKATEHFSSYDYQEKLSKFLIRGLLDKREDFQYQHSLQTLPNDAVLECDYIIQALEVIDTEEDPRIKVCLNEYKNCWDKNDYITALEYAEKLLKLRGGAEDSILQGICFWFLQRNKEAIESYDKAIEIKPNDNYAWLFRGLALANLEKYEEAIASNALTSLNKAIELDPDYQFAWESRSWVLIHLEQYEEALKICETALSLGENDYYILANRAISLIGLKLWQESLIALEDAVKTLEEDGQVFSEDIEIILCILLKNIPQVDVWKNYIQALINILNSHNSLLVLSQALVRSIPVLMSEKNTNEAVQTWLQIWHKLANQHQEFQTSLQILNIAVRYRISKGDRRILLELPIEERKLLQEVLEQN